MTDQTADDLTEPDNPAAWALARHIADHPVSTIQAAFRYLNAPLTIEVREPASSAGQAPVTDQTALRDRIAADAVQRALGVLRVWRDEREIGPEAARLLYEVGAALTDDNPDPSRMADETQPAEADDTLHACPGRWGGPNCRCFDTDETQPAPHSCSNCEGVDPGTCLMNPSRPKRPPMDPVHILGIGAQQDDTRPPSPPA
ncbi:hypothetical protein [Streptomyces prasinopilosus]|uniref:hypothetical protein n=1 Tax=Streptomyces prasinopilosus TaxID=67344 RepID=UPI0006EB5764|nr:hypothetical protein [Streptomyces prasinopilosus]